MDEINRFWEWACDPTRPGPFIDDVIGLRVPPNAAPVERARLRIITALSLLLTVRDTTDRLLT